MIDSLRSIKENYPSQRLNRGKEILLELIRRMIITNETSLSDSNNRQQPVLHFCQRSPVALGDEDQSNVTVINHANEASWASRYYFPSRGKRLECSWLEPKRETQFAVAIVVATVV